MPNESHDKEIRKRTGTFNSFDGTPVYYEVRGSGPPIFLCYGIACLINHWTHQLRYFSQNYQTVVLDYRGHHGTPAPADIENLSIDAICRDVRGLMEHLEIEKASFWGHSYGAMILLRFFDLYPEAVSNLVFINGFASNPLKGLFGVDAVGPAFEFFKQGYQKFPTTFSTLWRAAVSNPLAIPIGSLAGGFNLNLSSLKDIEVYARGVAAMDLGVFITLLGQMINYDGTGVLDRINAPTLIISGSKDGVTPQEYQQKLHQKIRGSQFLSAPYGSHCTQLDLPDFVNLRIEKFLKEVGY